MSGILQLADGRSVPVVDGLVMGRAQGLGLTLDDEKASRRHAKIAVQLGVVELEDLGSRNGTLLNGTRVDKRMLRDGDEITIGTTHIRYLERAGVPAAPSVPPRAPVGGPAPGEDLFGEDEPEPAKPTPKVVPPPVEPPSPRVPANPPPAPRVDVLEFVDDDIVEVRVAPPAAPGPSSAPSAKSPSAKSPGAGSPAAAAGASRDSAGEHRVGGVLQFQAKPRKSGLLAGDISQLGGAARAGVVILALAIAGGLAWAALAVFG